MRAQGRNYPAFLILVITIKYRRYCTDMASHTAPSLSSASATRERMETPLRCILSSIDLLMEIGKYITNSEMATLEVAIGCRNRLPLNEFIADNSSLAKLHTGELAWLCLRGIKLRKVMFDDMSKDVQTLGADPFYYSTVKKYFTELNFAYSSNISLPSIENLLCGCSNVVSVDISHCQIEDTQMKTIGTLP